MAEPQQLLSGQTLAGRYRVEEGIGRGKLTAVYRALDETTRRRVAVRVFLSPDEETQQHIRARLEREAAALIRLHHPGVVAVHDSGFDAELRLGFLVMELLRGESLAARLAREGALPRELALRVLREAAEGVGAGHEAGMIHRDITPANLFLADDDSAGEPRVRVLGFGMARIVAGDDDRASSAHATCSPAHASPEQLLGDRILTPATDIYSLGVVGFELLSGEPLFTANTALRAPREAPPLRTRCPDVPAEVAEVIERALATEPDDRYPDASALADALRRAVAEGSGADAAASPPARYHARHKPRLPFQPVHEVPAALAGRSASLRALLVALLTAVLLLAAWWLLRGGDA